MDCGLVIEDLEEGVIFVGDVGVEEGEETVGCC